MENGEVIAEQFDVSNAAIPDGEVKRIFIGGVGAGVTAGDMENTFSPLGRVHTVEFIRGNGRSFAFMDFEPSSVRSLSKLFSTYNGCTWKGGKLKLEVAKEHYLARLKKEWAEDAKLASAPPPTKESLESVRSNCSSQENSQIRIFFPKLRKVKPLPFKGTGKHKYSFQRIEVPPLPVHLCDCEEHSKTLEGTSQKYLSPLSTVIHEKERNIITNVINKLMGADKDEIPSDKMTQVASDSKIESPRDEDLHFNEVEVSDADDDNLVMNIGIGAEDDILMHLKEEMTLLACQESGFGNPQSSQARLVQNKADSGKRKKSELPNTSSIKPNKRSHLVSADAPPKPESVTSDFSTAESGPAHAPKISAEMPNAETRPDTSNAQPAEGQSWLQKSSWKELVGGRGSSSFSISSILPASTASPEMPMTNASATIALKKPDSSGDISNQKEPRNARITSKIQNRSNINDAQLEEGQPWLQKSSWKDLVGGRSSISFSISNVLSPKASASDTIATKKPVNAQNSPGINPEAPVSSRALEMNSKESSSSVQGKPSEGQTRGAGEQGKERPEFSFGEVCPFMRNAESEQQWSKAKAALSGYLKRNGNEGNASKFSKGKQPSRR